MAQKFQPNGKYHALAHSCFDALRLWHRLWKRLVSRFVPAAFCTLDQLQCQ
ncbi:Uncharacterised protein [Vibrio cholerae]|nr:Uncharacterised protein [Vibrio cholerae]CSC37398.1 Uncharacterised protein [Vibrio cholerae]CSC97896.1 Uncharacterised protein [Vibrio cholerae]CSD35562.1 Uncharacterised protein [Vibrio cholerae]